MAAPRPYRAAIGARTLTAAILALAAPLVRALSAQGGNAPGVELAVEQQVRDRWMHGRQQPRFTPFASSRTWLLADSLRAGTGGERRLYLTLGRFAYGRDSAIVVFDADGRVVRLDASSRPPSRAPYMLPDDSARFARMRLVNQGHLTLPETRLWDLVPAFRATVARPGARWTDTLSQEASHEGFRQSLRGVRVSTLVGDTIVGGHRCWIVRDSARVHYEERWLEEERTLDTLVTLTRTGDGFVRGRYLYDPDLGLFRRRDDTTAFSGEAALRYPDSYPGKRLFRTPARYERYRHWDLYDLAGYSVRLGELRASAERAMGGMVIVPNTDVERRLADGDSIARDSVVAEWRRSDDPDRREVLFGLLSRWVGRDQRFRERLDAMRVAAGDTAYLYTQLARRAYSSGKPADTTDVRRMVAFMEDPGLAFAFNQSRDWLYENLRQGLTTWPPAVTRDTTRWPCTPAACRMLADQRRTAREPRLREVGLVALVTLDPARWADTVLARVRAGASFLEPAAMLVRGVGATWRAASQAPVPAPNAPWQSWAEWMNGVDPRYAAVRPGPRVPSTPPVRFEESHATAIRFYQARTGRDVVGELRRRYEGALSDSARLVFGAMLQGLGELRLSADEAASYFRSGKAAEVALAQQALRGLFFDSQTRAADSATAVALLDRLVALVVEGVPAWRALDGSPAGWARAGPELHSTPRRRTVFLLGDSLPPALREKWKDKVGIVTAKAWRRQPSTEAGVLFTVSSVRQVGPFALVTVSASERLARAAGQAPQLYAAMISYYLMERNGEWVVVARDEWVT